MSGLNPVFLFDSIPQSRLNKYKILRDVEDRKYGENAVLNRKNHFKKGA
jgi:hypothetical protein